MANNKLLFISWDGPKVNYLEGLFIPIFKELQTSFEIHVIQFSWNDATRSARISALCKEYGIRYTHQTVWMKPVPFVGKYLSLWKGALFLARYIAKNRIGLVMPRSTMPAKMTLLSRAWYRNYKIIFDADGLPIEERLEFAGLKENSLRYRLLKKAERKILQKANRILTRSSQAIQYLSNQHKIDVNKFAVVTNGRDDTVFKPLTTPATNTQREQLGIPEDAFVLVYIGSVGPQYGVEQMLFIYRQMKKVNTNVYLMILTTNPEYLSAYNIHDDPHLIVRTVLPDNAPAFLSVGDVGLAIRKASPAMKGVAPIKLGEYLLMGLPVIASSGIGDTELLLAKHNCVYLLSDYSSANLEKAVDWAVKVYQSENRAVLKEEARGLGIDQFSLKQSVDTYRNVLNSLLSDNDISREYA